MSIRASEAKAAGLDGVLASVVESVRAETGTIHFLGENGLLHLAAATPGLNNTAAGPACTAASTSQPNVTSRSMRLLPRCPNGTFSAWPSAGNYLVGKRDGPPSTACTRASGCIGRLTKLTSTSSSLVSSRGRAPRAASTR